MTDSAPGGSRQGPAEHRWLLGALLAVAGTLCLLVLVAQASLAVPLTLYVDADAAGLGNGSSWDDAFTTLQPALDAAGAGYQIWVAAGVYTPTAEHGGSGARYRSFQLKDGVALYGGFDPSLGATEFDDRNWVLHETILSGDVGVPNVRQDNTYHVVRGGGARAVLDGFTVTGGYADGWNADGIGAGMYTHGISPTLANVTFRDNYAWLYGGGIYNAAGSPVLIDCTFEGNSASSGAGMCNFSPSSPRLSGCRFEGNSASGDGGGMFSMNGPTPVLTDCTFVDNSAGNGGAMYNGGASPVLTNVTFVGNRAEDGGAIWNFSAVLGILTNCTFAGNLASARGGGMFNVAHSAPALVNCTFCGNSASEGGGMFNLDYSFPALTNCTFFGNSADSGGAILNRNHARPVLTNCILWGDIPSEIENDDSSPTVTYSDVQGGHEGEGNLDAHPWFVDPANGDFHLGACSSCIDRGDNAAANLPAYDFEGDARILDGDGDAAAVVDIGADEVAVPVTCWRLYLPLLLRGD